MTVDEAYMLTLARLPTLQVLNYGKITPQDRQNGELYYLSLIGKELSAFPEANERDILHKHPRYTALCEKYGEPVIAREADPKKQSYAVNPRSVAARLVTMTFHLSRPSGKEQVRAKEIPRSFDTYQVKAIVARLFDLTPFQFRLIWETDELDPVSQESIAEDDWDSSDDEGESNQPRPVDDTNFVKREVELVESTRDIGGWFYGDLTEARVRVDVYESTRM